MLINAKKTYVLGTRGSLLAVTQSSQIKEQLEKLTGCQFVIKTISTQGDQITNAPLWQLDGKDFFTRELDAALLNDEVDLVVHSYKDLGSQRPEGIELAAITERFFSNDILLIKKETLQNLAQKKSLVVGTSAPRRICNVENSLASFLPFGQNLSVKTDILRGNVNTRIGKLKSGQYDAIVLALAGLERLALRAESHSDVKEELSQLLEGLTFMAMPQSVFPSSASQGALGIECKANRPDQGELLSLLKQLDHPQTREEVKREREAFASYGGGCHLAVGIHVKKVAEGVYWHIHKGEHQKQKIHRSHIERPQDLAPYQLNLKPEEIFLGMAPHKSHELINKYPGLVFDEMTSKEAITEKKTPPFGHLFISVDYALEGIQNLSPDRHFLWSAGAKTMQKMAEKGYWVFGSADSLGEAEIVKFMNSKALQMMLPSIKAPLYSLTHKDGQSENGEIFESYQRRNKTREECSAEFIQKIKNVKACYWTSPLQMNYALKIFPELKQAKHASGLGKTLKTNQSTESSIQIIPMSNLAEFLKWCGLSQD